MHQPIIPIAFPQQLPPPDGTAILAADIGGTKTDMAIFEIKNGLPRLVKEHRYQSKTWNSLAEIAQDFTKNMERPGRMCISFAGPISNGKASGTNLHWGLDSHEISDILGIRPVFLINDLEANCYGLACLGLSDLQIIYPGANHEPGNAAVISPGTGLGEGGLFWDGQAYRPFATEGGHSHFAARNELDWELFLYLEKKYGHVSWERVISGPGIVMIFNFLWEVRGWETPDSLLESMKGGDPAAAIATAAAEGSPVCMETLRLFTRYFAEEAANLAMKFKATGGIYIGGGIIPKIWNEKHHAIFSEHFFVVGRMHPLVAAVPVTLILNQKTALWGAGYYGAFG
ncbi:MAG: ROK family protein [Lewinellaceae bacterium]|nr:ROK family protein [Saprospiraceae bacterium]MCB9340505.1 ROK family protein [Lewinellaceae bacterium]